jgi:uncharacterized lipoprotein YajG
MEHPVIQRIKHALAGLIVLASVMLAGCASTTATYSANGDLTVTSSRLLTNSAASLTRADGTSISVTSAVDQAGTAAAFKALGDVIGVLGKLVAPGAVPAVP